MVLVGARESLTAYGKCLTPPALYSIRASTTNHHDGCSILRAFIQLQHALSLPKRYFMHFYALGSLFNLLVLSFYFYGWRFAFSGSLPELIVVDGMQNTRWTPVMTLMLFQFHMGRRLKESMFLSKFASTSKILFGHYVVGLSFYPVTTLALLLDSPSNVHYPHSMVLENAAVSLCLFVFASSQQHHCHRTLARLRDSKQHKDEHLFLPSEHWFSLVSHPHYFFEILIYTSLLMLTRFENVTMWWCWLWVVTNLSITATRSHEWYTRCFPQHCSRMQQTKRLVPYCW